LHLDIDQLQEDLLAVPVKDRNVVHVLHYVYGLFGQSQGKSNPMPGDKTPANTQFIKLVKKQLPESKIIFLVRDPRDVMTSFLKVNEKYYSERFDFMLWRWKNSIDKYRSLSKKHPQDVHLLRYEDLVSDPQTEVDAITRFLDLQPEPGLLNIYDEKLELLGVKNAAHHQNVLNPISTGSIGAWKQFLTEDTATRITNKLGSRMEAFGYVR
jgi:hypothetical protein